ADRTVGSGPLQQVPLLGVAFDEAVQELQRSLEVLPSEGFNRSFKGLEGLTRPFVDDWLAYRHGRQLRARKSRATTRKALKNITKGALPQMTPHTARAPRAGKMEFWSNP
ncbi:MAG TPA: hypothetical protein VI589_08885, partial [Vicinamibacteria bacterium]